MRCTTERGQLVLEFLLDHLDALCKKFEESMSTMRRYMIQMLFLNY